VKLVKEDGNRSEDRAIRADGNGGEERVGDAEGDRSPITRKRVVEQIEDQMVLPKADRERHYESADRNDYAPPQLVEVLDDREPVFVTDRPDLHLTLRRRGVDFQRHLGLAVVDDLALERPRRFVGGGTLDPARLIIFVRTGDRVLELPDTPAE